MALKTPVRSSQYWIDRLELAPHPEGGYFRQTYAADLTLAQSSLPAGFTGPRPSSTAIYFLLELGTFSAFHRLRSDEVWHFYTGDALEVFFIEEDGTVRRFVLGSEIEQGQTYQAVVPAGCWFASRLIPAGSFALVGCSVAPGFHFDDFKLAGRKELTAAYPQHRGLIEQLTRT